MMVAQKSAVQTVFLDLLQLCELWTNTEVRALNAARYNGKLGEIWYTRLLPPGDDT